MNLLDRKRQALILLAVFIVISFFSPASETQEEKSSSVVVQLFQIKNLDIGKAKESVNAMLTKDENVGAEVESFSVERPEGIAKFLMVKDTPEKLQEIGLLIEQLDKEVKPVTEQPISNTVNLDFMDVPLSQILATVARVTNLNIMGGENLSGKISIHLKDVPLDNVFDIILKSSGYTYIKEDKLIRIVTLEESGKFLVTEIFGLKFVSAKKIQDAISHLLTANGKIKLFSNFTDDKYSNYLLVTDTAESLKSIRELVEKLDKKIRQVMIEVKFCEVTLNKDDKLGIDYVLQVSISGAKAPTTFPFGSLGQNIPGRPKSVTASSTTLTVGSVSFSNFTATLNALDTQTKVDLVASPSIAAKDGEQAEIVIGDKVPIPLYERNEQTGSIQITSYQDQKIGTLLRVTPFINNNNTVTLKVHPEVSEITGYTGPNNERPIVSTREATTTFTVDNGKTMVIGGLTKQKQTNTDNQIPILGKIPILGRIFQYKVASKERKELLIFITPTIIDEVLPQEEPDQINTQKDEGNG